MNLAEEQVVRGEVTRVTFRNPGNGYSVIQLKIPSQSEQLTVVGTFEEVGVGANVMVRGVFSEHKKYGRQLTARSISVTTPSTKEGIERYLSSGVIKGLGKKTAKRLVDEFGESTMDVLYQDPDRIANVSGIGRHRAQIIAESLADRKEVREIMRFLIEHNVSTNLSERIYDAYGSKAVETIRSDPYILARQMRGVGFATADAIALNLGLELHSPQRIKAGVYYVLEKAMDEGHCYLDEETLLYRARDLLELPDTDEALPHLEQLITEQFLIREEDAIYLKRLYEAEKFVAHFVVDRIPPLEIPRVSDEGVESALSLAEREAGIEFSAEQREAVRDATKYRLLLITGGPGCGKTTIIQALVKTFRQAGQNVALAAPTGRAAQRMSQVCGRPAQTIHRLLRYDPFKRGFFFNRSVPLEVEGESVDVVIIDEASMIDLLLAKDLLEAIPDDATLILVGDKDQLPSVGPGRVFADLISQSELQTVSLSRLFRRDKASTINDIAHSMNAGIVPDIPEPDGETKVDAYFLPRKDPGEVIRTIQSLVANQIPTKFGLSSSDIAVLTPSNRGPLGTIRLNTELQEFLNPLSDPNEKNVLRFPDRELRVGDRVCQRVNNYQIDDLGVFNGDGGVVYSLDAKEKSVVVEMWDGRLISYSTSEISQLSLAYAVTVHRSQGTEIPCVLLVLHESHYSLLERQLIYTAITRAKQLLIVVGSHRALSMAVGRVSGKRRLSGLSARIRIGARNVV